MTHSFRIEPEEGGNAILAAGDSLAFTVDSSECHGDVCDSNRFNPAAFAWSVEPAEAATIDARGMLRARRAALLLLTARGRGRTLEDSARVYPPIAFLGWVGKPGTANTGDTLRVSVVARDSAGVEIARLPANTIMGGTGMSGELLDWGGPGPTVVWLDKPGNLMLVARLAHRWDTLRLVVK
ncbi:MAG: hypothetical protein EXR93_06720 [Gemmatimonadetes bacterium]|nr:hypothetical protein [Gemmatimonadota bacterium]